MTVVKYFITLVLAMTCLTLMADELPNPEEDNLANFHLLDETCAGQCHEDESPSDDLEFEYNSCVECHDSLANLEGPQHNIKHQESESMECIECHIPHEEVAAKDICTDCHDEDDEELSEFYSIRLERYLHLSWHKW
ncbi:cytochrome c3 family protein [Vibrio hangzhouensis]|uniref:cytochrome c3 family protein n=1 Tax=Vibrio hangzhouensis TaxID=462991 RepID=UPI001C976E76|nr:cytochrome c3 family protein [Vibrio hangzhouensis]MBY6197250.1 cytochrome c3 family protein [Vibrio hangzhouensis]